MYKMDVQSIGTEISYGIHMYHMYIHTRIVHMY